METVIGSQEISSLPTEKFRVIDPIQVVISRRDGNFIATAPDLGMWVDGTGPTQQEAVDSLSETIIFQLESLASSDRSLWGENLELMDQAFKRHMAPA